MTPMPCEILITSNKSEQWTPAMFLGLFLEERGDTLAVVSMGDGLYLRTFHPSRVRMGNSLPGSPAAGASANRR